MQQIIRKIKGNSYSLQSISILSVQAFLLGTLLSLFFVDATANFLVFHTVKVLPEAYAAAGIAGIILVQLIHISESIKSNMLRFALQYSFVLFAFAAIVAIQFVTYLKFFLFFYFAATIPFCLLLTNTLQATASTVKVTNSLALTRLLDVILLMGIFAGGIWALIFKRTNTIPIEYIVGSLMFLVFMLQFGVRKYKPAETPVENSGTISSVVSYFSDLPFKTVLLVTALFILLSVVSFTFIDFTFLNTIQTTFIYSVPLSNFLVLFFLTASSLIFIFKIFVYQNLIKNFKINKAIILAPAATILALIAISIMLLFPKKFDLGFAYSLLFLGVVFTRIFVQLIRESFEFYTLKLNLVSQEYLAQKKINAGILTIFTFWSFFLAGMILLILKAAEVNGDQMRVLVNLLVALVWLFVAFLLNKAYNNTSLRFADILSTKEKKADNNDPKFRREFDVSNINYLRYVLNYQSYYQPHHFRKLIRQLPDNLKQKLGITLNTNNFIEENYPQDKNGAKHHSNGNPGSFFDTSKTSKGYVIESLTESISGEDRIMAVRLIIESRNPKYINILKLLVRDHDDDVKRQAISAITKFKSTDLIYEALEYLSHEDYADLVCDVLIEIGNDAVVPLSLTFNKPSINLKYQAKIIRTIAQIPSEKSNEFLLSKLDYPNKSIVFEAAMALKKTDFQSELGNNGQLLQVIERTIGNCAWLLNKINILKLEDNARLLYENLREEYNYTFELLMTLLELKFGSRLVKFLKQSRNSESSNEHREYGIEILSIIIDESLKEKLFPLLHNNSDEEKIRQLRDQFPLSDNSPDMAIQEIINIDLGYINKWTKSSAIIALGKYRDVTMSEDIIAQLYNPEPILSESAVYSIKKWGVRRISEMEARIPNKLVPKFTLLSENIELNKFFLLNQKIGYLKMLPYFSQIRSENLLHLAEIVEGIMLLSGQYHLFELGADEILPLFSTPYGELMVSDGGKNTKKLPIGNLYGLTLYAGKLKIEAISDSMLYMIKPENLTTIVLNFEDISDALFNYLSDSKIH